MGPTISPTSGPTQLNTTAPTLSPSNQPIKVGGQIENCMPHIFPITID